MLFLKQESEVDDFAAAAKECGRYDFTDLEHMCCGKLQIDVLNSDLYRGFAGFYEEALTSSSALLYYPNEATENGGAA